MIRFVEGLVVEYGRELFFLGVRVFIERGRVGINYFFFVKVVYDGFIESFF